ncbi:MAG: ABC transporter ATP-binding protein [Bacilli bacterium]|jgi:ATP-binding cassette subfamily B multidrug efflux pump|nr:ABC transporter ATP-binding protein [Bacilli bacterium]
MARRSPSSVDKAKDFKGTLNKLLKRVSTYKILIILSFIFAIGSTIFAIISPKILGNATTEIFNGLILKISGTGGINFNTIKNILITLGILYVISALFSYVQSLIMTSVSQRTSYKLRKEVSQKLNKLPMSYFDKQNTGDILSIITNDIDTIQLNLNGSATQLVSSIVTVIGIFVMMCSINVTLAILTALVLPVASIVVMILVKKSQKHFVNQQKYLAEVDSEIEEMVSGHSVIKAFNAEEKTITKFDLDNKKLFEAGFKSQFLSGLMHPIMNFVGNLNYALIAIVGAVFAIKGKITVGNIQSFIQYSKQFTNPIAQLAQISSQIQSMIAASERVFNFLDTGEYVDNGKLKADNVEGNVEFKNVKFGYNEDKIIIKDFNAKINAGEKIAIVGPTGAGKTTIVKLLMRFYELNSGEILLDGKNITDYKRSELESVFAMVLQDTWLFNGTILDNLRYGNLNASDKEVIDAAKTANADYFIRTLPDGYNMVLNEETSNISGGQKQLLTIARAILANPKILILDEATSNVDTRTEELIQKAMDKVMMGRTSFIIAHRLSTIKNADLILVMNEGDIVEIGKHDELLEKKGFYAKIYNSQFEK